MVHLPWLRVKGSSMGSGLVCIPVAVFTAGAFEPGIFHVRLSAGRVGSLCVTFLFGSDHFDSAWNAVTVIIQIVRCNRWSSEEKAAR